MHICQLNFNDFASRRFNSVKSIMSADVNTTIVFVSFGGHRQMDICIFVLNKSEIVDPTSQKPLFLSIRRFGK